MSSPLVCVWNVSINGIPLDADRRKSIASIDFDERCDGSDTLTLTVNDPDYLYIEDNIFIEEAAIEANIFWYGDTHTHTFSGYISAIDINFPEDGLPSLSVFCLDRSHVMNKKKKKRSWDNVTSADVVRKIAQEYGFKCVIEPGYNFKTEDTISQSNSTDIAFCENLASNERDQFMCKLIGDTLYYVKKGTMSAPSCTLYYRRYPFDVVSFSPKINKETKSIEVEKSDINTGDKTVDSHVSNDSNTNRDVQGNPVNNGSSGGSRIEYEYDPESMTWKVKK